MNNTQLAATTGFLDKIERENETFWLGGWVLSFEPESVENFRISIGGVELNNFEITKNLPSPGVKKVHPNMPGADRARFLIKLPINQQKQQEFGDALISLIPLIKGREGEPLLNAVTPSLFPLMERSQPEIKSSTPAVEIIYIHVPKAAGTAFRQILQQVYGPPGVLTDTTDMFEDNMPATINRQTKVIDGHFRAGKYEKLFPDAKRITWLRQPIHRLISDFCFRQIGNLKQKEFLSKERLLEFAKIPGNQNLISYCINRKPLNYFYFVGIQEYFEEDLRELQSFLGWQEVKVVYQNRNPYPEYTEFKKAVLSDKKLMAELTALNSEDIKLYQGAWKLREQRKQGLISWPPTPPPRPKVRIDGGVATAGSVDKAILVENSSGSPLEKGEIGSQLEIKGWIFSRQAGLANGLKVTIGGLEVSNVRQKLGMPSPDVKKIHPKFPAAAKARFELQVPLTPEQVEQLSNSQIVLTPLFKSLALGEGNIAAAKLAEPSDNTQVEENSSQPPVVFSAK